MVPIIPYLTTHFEKASVILFTGAGFSMDAKNIRGAGIPSVNKLKEQLWNLCFPDVTFDRDAALQDVYEAALMRDFKGTKNLLVEQLSV